jgi:hypothetical protein
MGKKAIRCICSFADQSVAVLAGNRASLEEVVAVAYKTWPDHSWDLVVSLVTALY